MNIFWLEMANNGWKIALFGQNLRFFVCQHMRPCLMGTLVIRYGFYCKIGEVLVDLLPFFNNRKIDVLFQKNLWGLIFSLSKLFIGFICVWACRAQTQGAEVLCPKAPCVYTALVTITQKWPSSSIYQKLLKGWAHWKSSGTHLWWG